LERYIVKESKSKSLDADKIPLVDQFKMKIIEASKNRYKREYRTGHIYEKKYSYYYTCRYTDPWAFVNAVVGDDPRFITLNTNNCNNLLNFIKVIQCTGFDFIELDYNYIGFNNGIYDLNIAKFIPTNEIVGNIQVRVCHDMAYEITETPNLNKYLEYQFTEEQIDFNYFLLGRTLTKLTDNFQFMVLLYGEAGTGKSLQLKLIKKCFGEDQIGIFSNSFQTIFGASELAGSQIVLSDDMPSNIAKTLEKSDFLAMMSRGPVSCSVKGGSPIKVHDWNIPTLINSNFLPNYTDYTGEIVRRIWMIRFNNPIDEEHIDTDLETKIFKEFPTFLHKCRSTYLSYYKKYGGQSVESFAPECYKNDKDILRESSNNTFSFIKEFYEYDEKSFIEVKYIRSKFKKYLQERYDMKQTPKESLNIPSIRQVDKNYIIKKQNLCKSCNNHHKTKCCANYTRDNRTSKEFIYGIKYKQLQCTSESLLNQFSNRR
jgi:phage/plasmid-associated DNA primase